MIVAVAALAAAIASPADPPSVTRSAASALEVSLDADRCSFLARDHLFKLVALELDARVAAPDRPLSNRRVSKSRARARRSS